ncbi:hypothetical protein U1Q18_018763 [Sarracenia purpurea var. burkii]
MKSSELYDPGRQPPPANNRSSVIMLGGGGSSRPCNDDVPLNRFAEGQVSPSPPPLRSASTQGGSNLAIPSKGQRAPRSPEARPNNPEQRSANTKKPRDHTQ